MKTFAIVSACDKCGGWCCRSISIHEHLYLLKNCRAYPFWKAMPLTKARVANPWLPAGQSPKTVYFV